MKIPDFGLWFIASLGLLAVAPEAGAAQLLIPDVSHEEVVRVGGPHEQNGHFISRAHGARLVDSTTITYVDATRVRRLTVADLRTGAGWESLAGEGPFASLQPNALQPEVFTDGDTIRVHSFEGTRFQFLKDGELLSVVNGEPLSLADSTGSARLTGFLYGGIPVQHYFPMPSELRTGVHQVPQALRMGDLDLPIGSLELEQQASQGGLSRMASPPSVSTRRNLTAYAHQGGREVVIVRDGVRASYDMGWQVEAVHVDASKRIWVRLHQIPVLGDGYGWIVLDELGETVMRVVPPRHFVDAYGDWMLTQEYSEPNTAEWVLYRLVAKVGPRGH